MIAPINYILDLSNVNISTRQNSNELKEPISNPVFYLEACIVSFFIVFLIAVCIFIIYHASLFVILFISKI
jgi:hypothetical protein